MSYETLDLIFNICAAVMVVGFTVVVSGIALAFLIFAWRLFCGD